MKCWHECREAGTYIPCSGECEMTQPFWETCWQFIENVNIQVCMYKPFPLEEEK
jgi:hypothetical protein